MTGISLAVHRFNSDYLSSCQWASADSLCCEAPPSGVLPGPFFLGGGFCPNTFVVRAMPIDRVVLIVASTADPKLWCRFAESISTESRKALSMETTTSSHWCLVSPLIYCGLQNYGGVEGIQFRDIKLMDRHSIATIEQWLQSWQEHSRQLLIFPGSWTRKRYMHVGWVQNLLALNFMRKTYWCAYISKEWYGEGDLLNKTLGNNDKKLPEQLSL